MPVVSGGGGQQAADAQQQQHQRSRGEKERKSTVAGRSLRCANPTIILSASETGTMTETPRPRPWQSGRVPAQARVDQQHTIVAAVEKVRPFCPGVGQPASACIPPGAICSLLILLHDSDCGAQLGAKIKTAHLKGEGVRCACPGNRWRRPVQPCHHLLSHPPMPPHGP